jgi:hypothetical protein
MTSDTLVQKIPRTVVRMSLRATRLPLHAAEAAFSGGAADWPPTLAYEGVEAGVKRAIGVVLRDEVLRREGELEGEKVDRLRHAADLTVAADLREEEADRELLARKQRDADLRQEAARTEQQRKAEISRKASERKQKAARSAAARQETVREAEEARKKAAARRARARRRTTIEAETDAVKTAKAANRRAQRAKKADEQIERSAAARRNGR